MCSLIANTQVPCGCLFPPSTMETFKHNIKAEKGSIENPHEPSPNFNHGQHLLIFYFFKRAVWEALADVSRPLLVWFPQGRCTGQLQQWLEREKAGLSHPLFSAPPPSQRTNLLPVSGTKKNTEDVLLLNIPVSLHMVYFASSILP